MISLSTAEAESYVLVNVAKEIIHVQRLVGDISDAVGMDKCGLQILFSDNQPAIDAVANGKGRTKHYDLRIK